MPRRPKPTARAILTLEFNVPQEPLDQLVKGPMTQGDLESMFRSLKKAVIERAMSAEMSEHLGYGHGESKPEDQASQRNVSVKPATFFISRARMRTEVVSVFRAGV